MLKALARGLKSVGKSVEHGIRAVKTHVLLQRRYGTRRPEWVAYPDYNATLSISRDDRRAIHRIALAATPMAVGYVEVDRELMVAAGKGTRGGDR